MDKENIKEIADAIAKFGISEGATQYNWALISEMFDHPLIVSACRVKDSHVRGKLTFFNGFVALRDYGVMRQCPDAILAMDACEIDHFELLEHVDGTSELIDFRPGFRPCRPSAELSVRLAPVLYECYGMLMKFEENPDLPTMYKDQGAMFARKEGLDGKWRNFALPMPNGDSNTWSEKIVLSKSKCAQAGKFEMANGESWELDFVRLNVRYAGEDPSRFVYLFAAVNAATGEVKAWNKLVIPPDSVRDGTLNAVKPMWESLASQILDGIIRNGKIPAVLVVRSQKLMRLLRPLAMQLPFKIVFHRNLPMLTKSINIALENMK